MFFIFQKGQKVEVVECPPSEYGYGDYVTTTGFFEYGDNIGGLYVVIKDRKNQRHWFNMQASTVVEVREV